MERVHDGVLAVARYRMIETRKRTGREGSPFFGVAECRRNTESETVLLCAVYSPFQISWEALSASNPEPRLRPGGGKQAAARCSRSLAWGHRATANRNRIGMFRRECAIGGLECFAKIAAPKWAAPFVTPAARAPVKRRHRRHHHHQLSTPRLRRSMLHRNTRSRPTPSRWPPRPRAAQD